MEYETKWVGKYKSPKEYYLSNYDPKYYEFDKFQLEIDPDETMEEVEAYDQDRQQKEIIKCAQSFFYFCHKYIKILHPTKGLIPFVLFKYQCKVIKDYEQNRFCIISKFRQGGLTTVTLLWGLWRCMFKLDQQIMLLSKTDREATDIGMIVDRAVEHFPTWLKPKKDGGKWNDHLKMFNETGGAIKFYSPEAARGKAVTFLIVDEAAFIPEMDKHWKAMWPVLSTGGSCTLISTVNGMGNWYQETYSDAQESRNKFHVIDLDYWEHPDYNDPEWISDQKAQLGEKGFLQEVMRQFLGTGQTYINYQIIMELTEKVKKTEPIRKLFPQYVNLHGRAAQLESEINKGALWIWKEPIPGREYILSADCSDGQGENNDASCFQILDLLTLEQVGEFYSNLASTAIFAQIIYQTGVFYNTALVVIENMGPGGAVLSHLQHQLEYENLYYEKHDKIGIKIGQSNRMLILDTLQSRLCNKSLILNSIRLVDELNTFEYNPNSQKAEARKGKHDDAIMAMAIGLYVKDLMVRNMPVGHDIPAEKIKNSILDEIKRELEINREDFIDEETNLLNDEKDDVLFELSLKLRRKNAALLKEFGW